MATTLPAYAVVYTLLGCRCVTRFDKLTDALTFAVRAEIDGCTDISVH
ncbi:hypothetical protein [Cupriavidus sp. BIC8F]|nr:hypothetical protein [Cupriavidus sp. BIC8F]